MKMFLTIVFTLLASVASAQVPNYLSRVEACAAKYPQQFACAHSNASCHTDFVILCARDLNPSVDNRVGLNGKRGNPNDLSMDILAIKGVGTAIDVTNGNRPMEIVDICAGCGAPGQRVVWNAGPGGPGDRGAWVDPYSVKTSTEAGAPGTPGGNPGPTPTPTPTPTPVPAVNLQPILDRLAILDTKLNEVKQAIAGIPAVESPIPTILKVQDNLASQADSNTRAITTAVASGNSDLQRAIANIVCTPTTLPTIVWPEYKGSILGIGVTLRPSGVK